MTRNERLDLVMCVLGVSSKCCHSGIEVFNKSLGKKNGSRNHIILNTHDHPGWLRLTHSLCHPPDKKLVLSASSANARRLGGQKSKSRPT